MRAKPSSNTRAAASKSNRANGKPSGGNPKGVVKKSKESEKKTVPDLSILRQPVDTSICGLKQAVKVFETGTPEVLHLLTYDCDVVYECKVCRNLFRSIANFISHKRVYCTLRYSRSQDLRSSKEAENYTVIVGEKATEKLPTRITARKDLTSIVESISGQTTGTHFYSGAEENVNGHGTEKKPTTVHLEPIDNTSYGVFQTVLKPDSEELMRNQVTELQKLLSQNEVILGPDGRILQNGFADLPQEVPETEVNDDDENTLICSVCNTKFANRKTLVRHKRMIHESVRASYSCPCCKNYFANPWSVYRHLYKVHRKTNEQVRRLRSQIHKRDVKVEKPVVNNVSNKKLVSPSKKKIEAEQNQKFQQDNKEWMDHFEDDWELQRCGGCGRKFERKAALISHSQICQKRIAAYNRIEQNQPAPAVNLTPVVALSPISCSKKPIPKPSPEKKIGIQVRMNYCKNSSANTQQVKPRSVISDESDVEALSVDGKESFFQSVPIKNSIDMKESSVLEEFFKNANKCCNSEDVDKVQSYLNHSPNGIDKVHTYEISTCKRSTFLRSNIGKSKSLEAKCLQLRNALENGMSDTSISDDKKEKDLEAALYLDGNVDNTSESNTSAISSLSSQLTPLVDKAYVCEVEQSIEIKNINISRTLEKVPSTEADSTSMSTSTGLHMTFNSHTYTGNIKFSPNGDATCEEVSTSVISDELPQLDSNLQVDSSYLNDDEISVDLKPISFFPDESKSFQETELENTISILTRNQLKAICRDDFTPANNDDKKSTASGIKKNGADVEVEATTKEMAKKKLYKYADLSKNACSICNRKFKKLQDVYRHIPTHTRWKRYECLYNGCTFQTFMKKTCLHHVTLHTKEHSELSSDSLVGLINPNKWNLRLVENIPQTRVVSRNKNTKLVKTVNRLSKKSVKPTVSDKTKLKSKVQKIKSIPKDARKIKISKFLSKVGTKQKLLTEFKNFSKVSKFNGKNISQTNKLKKPILQTSKRKVPVNSLSPKTKKSNLIENGIPNKDVSSPKAVKPAVKRPRVSNTVDPPKAKLVVPKKEIREDEIIVNHITVDSSESNTVRGRSSRTSSRKSSVNSVDHQKGKNLTNSVVKIEDSNVLHFAAVASETQASVHFQNPEIVDGSTSMEEEESQESDKTVDDSHLKKIFMEVIFGPTTPGAPTVQSPGRPVRNKSRPKRDSDFILGGSKESERDVLEGKSAPNKKPNKTSPAESKAISEISRKSK